MISKRSFLSWSFFVVCLAIFVALRLLAWHKDQREVTQITRPFVPDPLTIHEDLLTHPWILTQPGVTEINQEMVRDIAALNVFCAQMQERGQFTYDQTIGMLIGKLQILQQHIPFQLPNQLYSVICIPEVSQEWLQAPWPFHVYQRLYLGEMDMGMPFYLDVRVFELNDFAVDDLIQWHLDLLDSEVTCHYRTNNRQIYTAQGHRTRDSAHGFARGARGLFADFIEQDGKLFVLYAEAPLKTFKEHADVFSQLLRACLKSRHT